MIAEGQPTPESESDKGESSRNDLVSSDLLGRIPEHEREDFARKLGSLGIRITREEYYSGPLQPASEAERWEALVAGTAERNFDLYEQQQLGLMKAQDRLLTIAEKSVAHKIKLESRQHDDSVALTESKLNSISMDIRRGQWFAFLAFTFISLGGFYMVSAGHDALGIAVLVFEAVGIASVFLHQMRREPAISRDSTSPDS